jgi:hypothetical protein
MSNKIQAKRMEHRAKSAAPQLNGPPLRREFNGASLRGKREVRREKRGRAGKARKGKAEVRSKE